MRPGKHTKSALVKVMVDQTFKTRKIDKNIACVTFPSNLLCFFFFFFFKCVIVLLVQKTVLLSQSLSRTIIIDFPESLKDMIKRAS